MEPLEWPPTAEDEPWFDGPSVFSDDGSAPGPGASPSPPPPPPAPHAGTGKPFLPRDPRARFKPTDQPNPRLARATELLSVIVNSLMASGQLIQVGFEWEIDPAAFPQTGLTGTFNDGSFGV